MEEESVLYKTPIGALKLVANDAGICAIKWLFGKHSDTSHTGHHSPETDEEAKAEHSTKAQEHLSACKRWLDAYFDGSLLTIKPPIPKPPLVLPDKSPFFHSVWDTLISSGIGETLTYKELAQKSGKPTAARAAGNAVKSHSLPILVPCHRVVKSTGQRSATKRGGTDDVACAPYKIGQYSGGEGTETKQWLLEHEQSMLKQFNKD